MYKLQDRAVVPNCARPSEQVPLVWVRVTAGNEGFTQGSEVFRRIVAPNLHTSAEMAACSSMRLLVVAGSPPVNSRP